MGSAGHVASGCHRVIGGSPGQLIKSLDPGGGSSSKPEVVQLTPFCYLTSQLQDLLLPADPPLTITPRRACFASFISLQEKEEKIYN